MKKPLMATLGLAGACVACCTIPLAVPMLGASAALGLTSWLGVTSTMGLELIVLIAMASTAAVVWVAMAWSQYRRAKDCGVQAFSGGACAVGSDAKDCGCAPR